MGRAAWFLLCFTVLSPVGLMAENDIKTDEQILSLVKESLGEHKTLSIPIHYIEYARPRFSWRTRMEVPIEKIRSEKILLEPKHYQWADGLSIARWNEPKSTRRTLELSLFKKVVEIAEAFTPAERNRGRAFSPADRYRDQAFKLTVIAGTTSDELLASALHASDYANAKVSWRIWRDLGGGRYSDVRRVRINIPQLERSFEETQQLIFDFKSKTILESASGYLDGIQLYEVIPRN